jgi:tetratricopeptide (TPR) repeat protein
LVWDTFQQAKIDRELVAMFRSEPDWRWQALPDLLEALSSLPLTPTLAYALSLLGTEPLGCDTIAGLTGFPQAQAAQLVATLWALGGLNLVCGVLPLLPKAEPPPPTQMPVPELEPEPELELAPEPEPAFEPILLVQEDLIPPLASSFHEDGAELDFPEPTPTALPPISEEDEEPSASERAHSHLVKAKSYLLQDRTSEAIRALEQAIKLDGDSPGAFESWLLLGRLRINNPAWSTRAIEALQVASRLNSRAAEPWALMGELYHRKGFKANAQGCFRRALELDPSVAVPAGWSQEAPAPPAPAPKEGQAGLMGKLRGMFGRE